MLFPRGLLWYCWLIFGLIYTIFFGVNSYSDNHCFILRFINTNNNTIVFSSSSRSSLDYPSRSSMSCCRRSISTVLRHYTNHNTQACEVFRLQLKKPWEYLWGYDIFLQLECEITPTDFYYSRGQVKIKKVISPGTVSVFPRIIFKPFQIWYDF